jgi:hypothetical protein
MTSALFQARSKKHNKPHKRPNHFYKQQEKLTPTQFATIVLRIAPKRAQHIATTASLKEMATPATAAIHSRGTSLTKSLALRGGDQMKYASMHGGLVPGVPFARYSAIATLGCPRSCVEHQNHND